MLMRWVVALLMFCSIAVAQSSEPPASGDTPRTESAQPATHDERGTEKVPLTVKILPAEKPEAEAQREEHDRRQKAEADREKAAVDEHIAKETQRIADYTYWLGAFTLFIFFVAVVQAGLFVWQLKVTRDGLIEQATSADRQLTATQRPWVKLNSVVPISDLVFENGEGHIELLFQVSNKGNSPGLRVRVDAKIVSSNQISLLDEQKQFAAAFRAPPGPNELRPELTSWTGDTLSFPVRVFLNSIDMPRFKPFADRTPFPVTILSIVGCITYEFSFAPGYHQTGIIYDLRKITPYSPGQFGQFEPVAGAVMLNDGFRVHIGDLARPLPLNFVGTGPVD